MVDTKAVPALEAESEVLDGATTKIRVRWNGTSLSVGSALDLCVADEVFRGQLIALLAGSPLAAYFWELPPITVRSLQRPFEFVVSEARALAKAPPDIRAFQEHFAKDDDRDGVVAFENLRRDAVLVVPCPRIESEAYVHLAAFLRGAPEQQTHALLRCVADSVLSRISDRPLWLSTAGLGVHWLHVRLDSRPKYYRHGPYKSEAASN